MPGGRDEVLRGPKAAFLASVDLNQRLSDHGVEAGHLEALVEQAFADPCHQTNAVPVTADDLRQLYLEVI